MANNNGLIEKWTTEVYEENIYNYPGVIGDYGYAFLSYGEMATVQTILTFKFDKRHPFPSVQAIAKKMRASEAAVRKFIRAIKNRGLLRVIGRQAKNGRTTSNEYDFNPLIQKCLELAKTEEAENREKRFDRSTGEELPFNYDGSDESETAEADPQPEPFQENEEADKTSAGTDSGGGVPKRYTTPFQKGTDLKNVNKEIEDDEYITRARENFPQLDCLYTELQKCHYDHPIIRGIFQGIIKRELLDFRMAKALTIINDCIINRPLHWESIKEPINYFLKCLVNNKIIAKQEDEQRAKQIAHDREVAARDKSMYFNFITGGDLPSADNIEMGDVSC